MEELRNKDSIKLIIIALIVIMVIIVIISYTYSFFQVEEANTTAIKGKVFSVNLSLEVNKITPSTELGLIPQLDNAITSAVVGSNDKSCIDAIGNEICQVYEIKVTNTSNVKISVDGSLELSARSNTNLKWARISNAVTATNKTKPTLLSDINSWTTNTLTANEEFIANETKYYYVVIWISEMGQAQSDNGDFSGIVYFGNSIPESPSSNTLYALNIVPKSDTPDFKKTSCSLGCEEATVGVYPYEDDLGTSYYFRGDVENNYVYFANKYWRIIRINGDGTVRMIYDGTSAHANGESSTDRRITTSAFNKNNLDNAFVGYMNGTTDGTNFPNGTTTSVSYTEAHTNNYDSTIKTYLEDTWYSTISASDKEKIADAIYCNDRKILLSQYTGLGKKESYYGSYTRLVKRTEAPTLICINSNDRFTLESTNFEIETNGKLEASLGLITADELVLAGGTYSNKNNKYYLYSGHYYWTMSPYGLNNTAIEFAIDPNGKLGSFDYVSNPYFGVRPVISLKSNAIKSGTGTRTNPYKITA